VLVRILKFIFPLPRAAVLIIDCILTAVGYLAAYVIRFGLPLPAYNVEALRSMIPWMFLSTGAVFGSIGLYSRPVFDVSQTSIAVLVAVGISELLTMAGAFWFRSFAFPRTVFGIAFFIHAALMIPWRYLVSLGDKMANGQMLLLGISEAPILAEQVMSAALNGHGRVVRWVSPDDVLARQVHQVRECDFTGVLLVGISDENKRRVTEEFITRDKHVLIVPSASDIILAGARIAQANDQPILLLAGLALSPGKAFLKRLLDLGSAVVATVLLAPVMLISAFALLISCGSPVLYVQKRTGLRGRVFSLWKFRTMIRDAETLTGPVLASQYDPRITPVGRILRATRIDEIPQLFNVVRGDMSIVGPRPERPEFVAQYENAIPAYKYRHLVKPGLTGLAQVRGRYSTRPEEKLLFDLSYISNHTFMLDLSIIVRTIVVALTPSAAQGVDRDSTRTRASSRQVDGAR
jgi:exopolysaccharide biosynthesis polyprenyl glycosylphosphotransferase